ncbi:Uncharacterised protein [Mycobacteroides abscessus]|nr:Uncharacterised protein [Mycobacteroides abscessus]
MPVVVAVTSFTARARPKSVTLSRPSVSSRTFSGLMSRCTSPARWAAASASSTWSSTSSVRPSVKVRSVSMVRRRFDPATYSIVR